MEERDGTANVKGIFEFDEGCAEDVCEHTRLLMLLNVIGRLSERYCIGDREV